MTLTPRESVLALLTGAVLVLVLSGMLIKPKIERWQELRNEQSAIEADIDLSRSLVAARERWIGEYRAMSKNIPRYPADQKMDIHWLSIMDRAAARNGVRIIRRQAGEEIRQGVVYEMPIECQDWEGSLDALVRFLFDLQKETAMMDVRQLLIRPRGRGMLRGRFSLACIYTRAEQEQELETQKDEP